jgi:glycosyltransferase involved in cell wall biosynthesis
MSTAPAPGAREVEATPSDRPRLLAVASQGSGGDDENRLRALLEPLDARFVPFDRRDKRGSFSRLLRAIREQKPDLVVLEGTGLSAGLAVMLGKLLSGVPYVVSSGDAVGPFFAQKNPLLGPIFGQYERRLYGRAAGFIGWSPYMTGRALTFGVPRAMTAATWAFFDRDAAEQAAARRRVRADLGIDPAALVVGIVGSLAWSRRVGFCYGLELVEAMRRLSPARTDLVALIVGDGSGRDELQKRAGDLLGRSILLPGRVIRDQVPDYLAAMDLASLPQSLDGVGSVRYTTKLSEYLAAGLPIVTGQIPLSYDLDAGWLWRLPGPAPWHPRYLDALAALLSELSPEAIADRQAHVPRNLPEFDRARQVARTRAFIEDLIADRRSQNR